MYKGLADFYTSSEWNNFRNRLILERTATDGFVYDEITNEPILKKYDMILHHVTELNNDNVFDYNIALNPNNIKIVSHKTHNKIHDRNKKIHAHVYIVYGSPLSGKTTYVSSVRNDGDLVIDMDAIWMCVSGCEKYVKPDCLKNIVFKIRDDLMDCVKYKLGKWRNAYIIGGFALISERERMKKEYNAEEIFIDTKKEVCLERLEKNPDGRDKKSFENFINEWWNRYTPPDRS